MIQKNNAKDFYFRSLFVFYAFVLFACQKNESKKEMPVPVSKKVVEYTLKKDTVQLDTLKTEPPRKVSIIGVGDMMLGTNYPSKRYLPKNDGKNLFTAVNHILQNADVTFGNLEGTLFDDGGDPKECKDSSVCYVFRTPAKYVNRFVEAGFDVLSIANNHSGDFGAIGRNKTKATLKKAGIHFAGLKGSDETSIFEKNGVKFGFCAFAPNTGTCDIRQIGNAKKIVSKLAKKVDVVIVSFHGGAEGKDSQHTLCETETYHEENRGNVCTFSHAVVDAGADVVFGHGPHVTRALELYKDRIIAYSLGNFCTYGRFSLEGEAGVAPILKVFVQKDGTFESAQISSIFQQKAHGPKLDAAKRALKILQRLSKSDFPKSPLKIKNDGSVVKI